ncbi:hypothetical protein ACET3Z_014157 [Daucus carota]
MYRGATYDGNYMKILTFVAVALYFHQVWKIKLAHVIRGGLLHDDGSQRTNASDKEAVKNADVEDLDAEVSEQNIESEDDVEVSDQDVESVDLLD